MDGSHVYGSTEGRMNELRSFENGMLKENRMGEAGFCTGSSHCNMPFLPENPGGGNTNFFDAGDHRVKRTTRINIDAHDALSETRRIVIAVIQHISYNEFLALLLGKKYMSSAELYSGKSGFFTSYNSSFDPSIRNVFSAAAMRVGHTFITGIISGENSVNLETVFNDNTFMLRDSRMFPSLILKGECKNPAERYDVKLVDAITNKLFALPPSFTHGNDLMSLNIQRARDHGIPSYNNWRVFCGKNPFNSFDEMRMRKEMPPEVIDVFQRIYQSVHDIDLFPAMLGEFRTTYGSVGDTFSCILSRQFRALKFGDRFWYEGSSQPKPFTLEQLGAIRQTSLASVICSTSTIKSIQPYPMLQSTLRSHLKLFVIVIKFLLLLLLLLFNFIYICGDFKFQTLFITPRKIYPKIPINPQNSVKTHFQIRKILYRNIPKSTKFYNDISIIKKKKKKKS
ncbi:Peroxidasin [Armadillidium nasatum]|uniref:Peroxidasin n=1 Tax=Armadillidium nasatum TaxID=96803 RepID=A0A5N5TB52_9CRUS|nr:Peroxidasin [Armadillidium nasatum]